MLKQAIKEGLLDPEFEAYLTAHTVVCPKRGATGLSSSLDKNELCGNCVEELALEIDGDIGYAKEITGA